MGCEMMFEKELEAIKEIDELKEKYKLDAQQEFVLRILKLTELSNQNYQSMLDYFIKNCRNCETKEGEDTLKE